MIHEVYYPQGNPHFIMKFSTAKEHRDFFQKHGWIEFEGLISDDQLLNANDLIDRTLAERLNVTPERLNNISSEKKYVEGHDLWRANPALQKLVSQARFTEIAAELLETRTLRLGCDQIFPSREQKPFLNETLQVYSHFLEEVASLEAISCLKGIACGVMICLGAKGEAEKPHTDSIDVIDVFPKSRCHVIFFQASAQVNWNRLYSHLGQTFYLVVFTNLHAHYQLEPRDPHTHTLKRLGYIFNDKLNDRLHPIIYR